MDSASEVSLLAGCDVCAGDHETEDCPQLVVEDVTSSISKARLSLPWMLEAIQELGMSRVAVLAKQTIPAKTKLGPFEAKKTTQNVDIPDGFVLKILLKDGSAVSLITNDDNECNWLCLVDVAQTVDELNCMALQMGMNIFYMTIKPVHPGQELKVWYAPNYAKKLGKMPYPDGKTTALLGTQLHAEVDQSSIAQEVDFSSMELTELGSPSSATVELKPPMRTSPLKSPDSKPAKVADQFKCMFCSAKFAHSFELEAHAEIHRMNIKQEPVFLAEEETTDPFDEQLMKMSSRMAETLDLLHTPRQTRIQHKPDQTGPHICSQCEEEFTDIAKLANHVKLHIKAVDMLDRKKEREARGVRRVGRPRKDINESDGAEETPVRTSRRLKKRADQKKETKDENQQEPSSQKLKRKKQPKEKASKSKISIKDVSETSSGQKYSLRGKKLSLPFLEAIREKQASKEKNKKDAPKKQRKPKNNSAPAAAQAKLKEKAKPGRRRSKKPAGETKGDSDLTLNSQDLREDRITEKNTMEILDLQSLDTVPESTSVDLPVLEESLPTAVATAMNIAADIQVQTSNEEPSDNTAFSAMPEANNEGVVKQEGALQTEADPQTSTAVPVSAQQTISMGGQEIYEAILNLDNIDIVPMEGQSQSSPEKPEQGPPEGSTQEEEKGKEDEEEAGMGENKEESEEQAVIDIEPENPEIWFQEALEHNEVVVDESQGVCLCVLCDKSYPDVSELQAHLGSHHDSFQCPDCANFYRGQESLQNHRCPARKSRKSKNKSSEEGKDESETKESHSCPFCGKLYEKLSSLNKHVKGHTEAFTCGKCGFRFARQDTLNSHTCVPSLLDKSEAQKSEQKHFCQFCGAGFAARRYLLRHMAVHTEEFKCKKCGVIFARNESLRRHVIACDPERAATGKISAFPCAICKKAFSKEVTLQNHMRLHSEDVHKCEECGKKFLSENSLQRHECLGKYFDRDASGKYCCKQCGKSFTRALYCQRHLAVHNGTFRCVICLKACSRKEEMMKHMLDCTASLHTTPDGGIECFVCKEMFTTVITYREHFLQHTHSYKCETCGKLFIRRSRFKTHKCDPWNGQPLECTTCHKMFKYPLTLKKHMLIHENKRFECERCHKVFHRADYIKDHMCITEDGQKMRIKKMKDKEVHILPGSQSYVCPDCGRSYCSTSNLNKHMLTHGEKKEECHVCHKKFHLKVNLKEHMSVHDKKVVRQCPHCGKLMKSRNSIYNHIQQFHSKVVKVHVCNECNKTFLQKGNLKKHMLMHSSEKKYKCQECEKSFRYPEQLKRHERWHIEGLKFVCEMCEGRFLMECDLKKHMRNVHSGVLYQCKYCGIECSNSNSIIRHLRKIHSDLEEWQEDSTEYIKSLIRHNVFRNKRTVSGATRNPAASQEIQPFQDAQDDAVGKSVILIQNNALQTTSSVEDGMHIDVQNLPQFTIAETMETETTDVEEANPGESPYIVAEITNDSDNMEPQTVIIQTGDNQYSSAIPQEVAEALQQLSSHGALDADQPTVINLGDLTAQDSQNYPVMLPNQVIAQDGGFIVVPMVNQEEMQIQEIQM